MKKTQCSICGRVLEVDDQLGETHLRCVACQNQPLPTNPGSSPPAALQTAPLHGTQTTPVGTSDAMKTFWLAVVCVTVLIGIAIWKSGGGQQAANPLPTTETKPQVNVVAIEDVLSQDQKLSAKTKASLSTAKPETDADLDRMAAIINGYVSEAKGIYTQTCPRDFAEAYYRHLASWGNLAEGVAAHPHIRGTFEGALEGFLRGLGGDWTGGALQVQDEMKQWIAQLQVKNAAVQTSWQEVEALATRYGAKLPQS